MYYGVGVVSIVGIIGIAVPHQLLLLVCVSFIAIIHLHLTIGLRDLDLIAFRLYCLQFILPKHGCLLRNQFLIIESLLFDVVHLCAFLLIAKTV